MSFSLPLFVLGLPGGSAGKGSVCNVGDLGSIAGLGRFLGEENSYLLQYTGLENSIDCIVRGVAKSQTRLSDFPFTSLHLTGSFIFPNTARSSSSASFFLLLFFISHHPSTYSLYISPKLIFQNLAVLLMYSSL